MIGTVGSREAVEFVSQYHYSGTAVAGRYRFGWYQGEDLLGVSIYDNGNHAMRCSVFGEADYTNVLHHHRLALHPDAPKFTASQFIAACNREMSEDGIWAIVTYADLTQGHDGTIYRATNALYTGLVAKGNLAFRKPSGEIVSTQNLSRVAGRALTWQERREYAKEQGWSEYRIKGRERYVYVLGNTTERRMRMKLFRLPVIDFKATHGE